MTNFKINDVVLINSTLSIGIIIDKGQDPNGQKWFRTDAEGVREAHELSKVDSVECLRDAQYNGYLVAPSTFTNIVSQDLLQVQ